MPANLLNNVSVTGNEALRTGRIGIIHVSDGETDKMRCIFLNAGLKDIRALFLIEVEDPGLVAAGKGTGYIIQPDRVHGIRCSQDIRGY